MNVKLNIWALSLAFFLSVQTFAQENINKPTINPEELETLLGEWKGGLTYIDYSSGKPYTMSANLKVKKGQTERQLFLYNIYPDEPQANSRNKLKISKNGRQINNKKISSRREMGSGQVEITTEHKGRDNNKNALIRNIYFLGSNQFIIRKEVRFQGSDEWIKRNEYYYKK